jgi:hypothetical protein
MAHSLTDLPLSAAFILLAHVVVVLVVGVTATGIRTEPVHPRTSTHTWRS